MLDAWSKVPQAFRAADGRLPSPWDELFGPLRAGTVDDLMVVAQLGQSLDGRIATPTGDSKYINGEAGIAHLHMLRALVDAVVIGMGTAITDDPQLTVRQVEGPHPARVVIDPRGRLPAGAKVLADDGTRRVVLTSGDTRPALPDGVEIVPVPMADGHMAPSEILRVLAGLGFRRVLIEGGADTVSRFLAARCLDRLHVVIAPIILGAGQASIALPPIDRVDGALRAPMRVHSLGNEVLFDCDLSAQRVPVGRAKMSM